MYRKYLRLKGCPKCGGDILVDRAYEDYNESCIQCGYVSYYEPGKEHIVPPPPEKKKRRRRVKQPA